MKYLFTLFLLLSAFNVFAFFGTIQISTDVRLTCGEFKVRIWNYKVPGNSSLKRMQITMDKTNGTGFPFVVLNERLDEKNENLLEDSYTLGQFTVEENLNTGIITFSKNGRNSQKCTIE